MLRPGTLKKRKHQGQVTAEVSSVVVPRVLVMKKERDRWIWKVFQR